jgi:hypothetical protein
VVLTLHDAWLLSGHCAHSFDCERWKTGCGECPDLTIPPAVWKIYPASKWGFFSQVLGGFTADKICVVTARVMLAPLTVTNGIIVRPAARATTYDAKANITEDECRAIARTKLKEATESVVSSLVKS